MRRARPVIILGAIAGCSTFSSAETPGSDGGAADAAAADCPAPTCADKGTTCREEHFESGCGAIQLEGDPSGTTRECTGGKLHIRAENTLDVFASLTVSTPRVAYSAQASVRMNIVEWDQGDVLAVLVDGKGARIRATPDPKGNVKLSLCAANRTGCADLPIASTLGTEHLYTFDLTPAGISLAVDCKPVATLPAVPLPTGSSVRVAFGEVDADPIDGTLDDVVVSFY